MLGDDDTAVSSKCFCDSTFSGDVEPGVGVGYLHGNIFNNGLNTKVVCGEAGNNFCIGICADVAELDVVAVVVCIGQLAVCNELSELHAGNDTCNVTGLVNAGKCVLVVGQAGGSSLVTGHSDEGDIGAFLCSLLHVGLMTVRVGEDDRTALLDEVDRSVIALFIFGNSILPDDLVIGHTEFLGSGTDTVDVGVSVAFIFVTDQDRADLEVCTDRGAAAGNAGDNQRSQQNSCAEDGQQLFHFELHSFIKIENTR